MYTSNSTTIIPANTGQTFFFTEEWLTSSILIINFYYFTVPTYAQFIHFKISY